MKIELIPYMLIDGIPTFKDSEIMGFYARMEEEGTAPTVFSDGTINNALDFLAVMKSSLNMLFIIFVDGEQSGVMWLNRFEARFARLHFCLFSNQWGKNSIPIGTEVRRIVMNWKDKEGNYLYDLLLGIIPSSNRVAIRYVKKCGGVIQGEIPNTAIEKGKSVSGTVIYYKRRGDHGET